MKLSPEALRLLRQVAGEVSEAYLVGGAGRDTRLGRPLKELDIAVERFDIKNHGAVTAA